MMASAIICQNLSSIAKSESRKDWRFQERQLIEARLTIKETGERFRGFVPRGATVEEAIEGIAKQNGGEVIKKYYSNMGAFEIVGIRIGRTILMKNEKEGIHWFIGENKIPIIADKNGNIYILNGKEMKVNEKTYDISVAMESSTLNPRNLKELTGRNDAGEEIRKRIECAHANMRENTAEVYEEKILLFDKDSGEIRFLSEYNNKAESFKHDFKFDDFGFRSYYLQPVREAVYATDFRCGLPERAVEGVYYLELLGCKVRVVDRIEYEGEREGPMLLRDRSEGATEQYMGTTGMPHDVEVDWADHRGENNSNYYRIEEVKQRDFQDFDTPKEGRGTRCNERKNKTKANIKRLIFFKERSKENNEENNGNAGSTKAARSKRKSIDTLKEKFICKGDEVFPKEEKGVLHKIERLPEKQKSSEESSKAFAVPIMDGRKKTTKKLESASCFLWLGKKHRSEKGINATSYPKDLLSKSVKAAASPSKRRQDATKQGPHRFRQQLFTGGELVEKKKGRHKREEREEKIDGKPKKKYRKDEKEQKSEGQSKKEKREKIIVKKMLGSNRREKMRQKV